MSKKRKPEEERERVRLVLGPRTISFQAACRSSMAWGTQVARYLHNEMAKAKEPR